MKHGLVGRSLTYSHSPWIHKALGASDFELIETEDVRPILEARAFESLMVTIPFKETVIPFLDELDDLAKTIGAVNLIVNKDGRLLGTNTDYHGLKAMILRSKFDVAGRDCVVLGSGGAAKCAKAVLEDLGAKRVAFLVRNPKSDTETAFLDIHKLANAEVVLNATPLGMHPFEDDAMPFSLKTFQRLAVYFDLVYNPLQTVWQSEAIQLGIPSFHGLPMLVHQAAKARSIVDMTPIDEHRTERVLADLYDRLQNLVLIGLPLSGKSKVASMLSKRWKKPILDSDADIEQSAGKSIEAIFQDEGEAAFRKMEVSWIQSHRRDKGVIVSTGGGMIENKDIVRILKQNGFLVFLDKNPASAWDVESTGRPLLKDQDAFRRLYERRRPLYLAAADLVIPAETPKEEILRWIEVKWNEAHRR